MPTDADLYDELMRLVSFAPGVTVLFGSNPAADGEQDYPLLWLCPKSWEELDHVDPESPERTCAFDLVLIGRGEGGFEQFSQLDEIATEVLALVRANDLGGLAIRGLTAIERGRVERQYPEERWIMEGSFSYLPEPLPADDAGQPADEPVNHPEFWGTAWEWMR